MRPDPLRLGQERPALAGGIDRDGSRAAELLNAGFGSVEFGTVSPEPVPGHHGGVDALVQRLAIQAAARQPTSPGKTLIGIGLGLAPGAPPAALPAHWLAGLRSAWPVADYLSFNLSAAAHQPLLAAGHATLLAQTLDAVARERGHLAASSRRHVALALKLPLQAPALPAAVQAALAAGFDAIITVLPPGPERLDWLRAWARSIDNAVELVAVGGIRTGADVRAVLAAGASGIQVHRIFAEQGAACLPSLCSGLSCDISVEAPLHNSRRARQGSHEPPDS